MFIEFMIECFCLSLKNSSTAVLASSGPTLALLLTGSILIENVFAWPGTGRLLFEAINGNQSHFVHAEEIIESWRIVDDLICTGEKCPIRTTPYIYHQGSWGPQHKTEFITNWDYPQ